MVEFNEFENAGFPPELRQPGEISKGGAVSAVSAPVVHEKTVVLSTKRLTLRPPVHRDREMVTALANNKKVAESLGRMPHPYALSDADHWIDTISKPGPLSRTFAITDRFTDDFLGGCGYRPFDESLTQVAIGYWLGEAYWGQGLAAEAAQAIIDYAFETEAITGVWLTIRATNFQSKRVAEKCGFQYARNGMSTFLALQGPVATDLYYMPRSTWESLHAWGAIG